MFSLGVLLLLPFSRTDVSRLLSMYVCTMSEDNVNDCPPALRGWVMDNQEGKIIKNFFFPQLIWE